VISHLRAVLLVTAAGCALACPKAEDSEAPTPTPEPVVAPRVEVPMDRANLFFPGSGGKLVSVAADVPQGPPELRITRLVEALIRGPGSESGLFEVLPATTTVGGVLLLDNVAYVDLRSPDGSPTPAVGSADERLILYSLIDTIVLGGAGADRVVLLWNGAQRETFAGHFDTTRPLGADTELITEP
jgi:Sporulation and spore germination